MLADIDGTVGADCWRNKAVLGCIQRWSRGRTAGDSTIAAEAVEPDPLANGRLHRAEH